jgi:hypothetical protein
MTRESKCAITPRRHPETTSTKQLCRYSLAFPLQSPKRKKCEKELSRQARIEDPLRRCKLSPMGLESSRRRHEYSRTRDGMLEATESKHEPWQLVRSDDKRKARLNCISHLLSMIPDREVAREIQLPKRSAKRRYDDRESVQRSTFIQERYQGIGSAISDRRAKSEIPRRA